MVTLLVLTFGPALMVLYLWSAMVAASRVILGVHFPTDTMVGGLLGSAIAYLAWLI
ncbi:MAG: phosphatase PAP2 family protein [Gammaproteobacteria bacterium]